MGYARSEGREGYWTEGHLCVLICTLLTPPLHPQASEDDIEELFSDHGYIQHMTVNRDRKMGRIKSVLVEYGEKSEAQDAVNNLDGSKLLGQKITVDWAFIK
jgi:RNA-binding protein 8A